MKSVVVSAVGRIVMWKWRLKNFVRRFWGMAHPVKNIEATQKVHGRKGSHVEAEWTTPEHWAHNNYERSHLPQLCVKASGWKARVIACLLWPKSAIDWRWDR